MHDNSTTTIILAIFTVGGTLIGALGGTWLGSYLERDNEIRKWRRNRCLEAYSEALHHSSIVAFEADKLYLLECGTLAHNEQMHDLEKRMEELYHWNDKVGLLAPEYVSQKFGHLALFCGVELAEKSSKCPKPSKDDWHKARVDDLSIHFSDCRNAARNDLEIFPRRYRVEGYEVYKNSIKELDEQLSNGTISSEQAKQRLMELKKELKKHKKEWDILDKQAMKNR